jgi:hypothetical protein
MILTMTRNIVMVLDTHWRKMVIITCMKFRQSKDIILQISSSGTNASNYNGPVTWYNLLVKWYNWVFWVYMPV